MKKSTIHLSISCLAFLLLLASCQTKKEAVKPPNVLMICIDDLNDWLGCMKGHPNALSPNMDALAAQGVLFTNAHCQVPLCGPSRASIMTGLRPSSTGIYGQIQDADIRRDNPATENITFLPEYFKQNGYHTMGVGKIFHTHAPDGVFDESGGRVNGFGPRPDERFVWPGTTSRENFGRTVTDWGAYPAADSLMPDYLSAQWAVERLGKNYDKPFFMAVGFLRPHVPWYVPQKWFDLHPVDQIQTPPWLPTDMDDIPAIAKEIDDLPMMPSTQWAKESGEWREIVRAYLACVSFVDYYVGDILNALKNGPHADNTIIVLWSDHGYRLGEKNTFAKHCLWEEATKVPLIFAGPGILKGKMIDEPAELLSLYPTLIELCKMEPYGKNQGISLAPALRGTGIIAQDFALTTYGYNNHAVRTKNNRYIRYQDGSEELYDHKIDPNEWRNLLWGDVSDNMDVSRFKQYLPLENKPYAKHSFYNYNPFFMNDKLKHSE